MLFNRRCCEQQPCCSEQNNQNGCTRIEPMVMEPTITNCIERDFYHVVPHCCPIHTHIINKQIYTNTYTPKYTCDEENIIVNNNMGSSCNFMNHN